MLNFMNIANNLYNNLEKTRENVYSIINSQL